MPIQLIANRDTGYAPLNPQEQALFESLLDESHVLRISTGAIHDGRLVITDGPLKGYENRIRSINRHKRTAYVSLGFEGMEFLVKAGLKIPERTGENRSRSENGSGSVGIGARESARERQMPA